MSHASRSSAIHGSGSKRSRTPAASGSTRCSVPLTSTDHPVRRVGSEPSIWNETLADPCSTTPPGRVRSTIQLRPAASTNLKFTGKTMGYSSTITAMRPTSRPWRRARHSSNESSSSHAAGCALFMRLLQIRVSRDENPTCHGRLGDRDDDKGVVFGLL